MTYNSTKLIAIPKSTPQTTEAPSPETLSSNKFIPRDLKFKAIALSEIKKVALILDFFSE
jgi:hypothetical protein